ncbi:MAG: hypothetical protein O9308_12870 [Beijerinckiaceae bacterium]|nr:hypothetical protein [Beijerinckiaceae bacterium]
MNASTMPAATRAITIPGTRTVVNLALGGLAGLLIWEIWARVLTKAVLGYPLEPAGLIDAIFQHNLGLSVNYYLREVLHYAVGIIGYPILYFVISRHLKNWSLVLDAVVFLTFSLGVAFYFAKGAGTPGHLVFWAIVALFIATRFINRNERLRDSIAWGTFTWLNALGLMAPLGGLSFYLLGEGGELSFMSFAGHVIYGAVAAWIFEARESRA